MPVPYTFASATAAIPLSNLDSNFATAVTIGNTAVQLGNTITTLNNVTINASTLSSCNIASGSANGVVYINSSNVVTSSVTGLSFTGANLGVGTSSPSYPITISNGTVTQAFGPGIFASGSVGGIGTSTNHPLAFFTNTAQVAEFDTSGNLLVNTTTQQGSAKLSVVASSGGSDGIGVAQQAAGGYCIATNAYVRSGVWYHALFQAQGSSCGSITSATNTTTLYNTTSDRRLKTDIVDFTDSGTYIDAFKPRSFKWTSDNSQDIGFITDEYQQVLPSAITGQPNATKEEEYEITPAVKNEQGEIVTPAVRGTRTIPDYQQGDFSTSSKMAIIIAELKSLRQRVAALEAKVGA